MTASSTELRKQIEELRRQIAMLPDHTAQIAEMRKVILLSSSVSNFMAYQSVAQAVGAAAFTTVSFQTEVFDDLNEFNAGTYTFVPAAAGTYAFVAGLRGTQGAATDRISVLFVNGSERVRLYQSNTAAGLNTIAAGCSGPVNLAAGDSVQIRYYTTIADTLVTGQANTYFGGWRIK